MLIVNSAVMVAIWEAQGLTLQCCFLYGCDLRYASACFHTSTINPCACCTILDQVVWLFIQLVPVLVAVERMESFFPHLQRLVNWGMWQAWGYSLEVAC